METVKNSNGVVQERMEHVRYKATINRVDTVHRLKRLKNTRQRFASIRTGIRLPSLISFPFINFGWEKRWRNLSKESKLMISEFLLINYISIDNYIVNNYRLIVIH